MKKIISLILALALMLSVMPVLSAAAEETETTAPVETTASTEAATVPAEEPAAPAEETTAPTEAATAPTEPATAPTEEATAPAEETASTEAAATAPTEPATVPSEETAAPTVEEPETAGGEILPTEESSEGDAPTAERGITQDEYGNYTFQTLEDLIELTSRTYDNYRNATYGGEGDLAITQSMTIPQYLNVLADTATVAEGVTLTMEKESSLNMKNLTVAGTLNAQDANVYIETEMKVTGSVILDGWIWANEATEITGMENIQFVTENSEVFRQVSAFSFEDMKRIVETVAQDTDPHVFYGVNIQPGGDATVKESLSFPKNVSDVSVFGNLIIPSGVTMTVSGAITVPPVMPGGTIHVQSGGALVCESLAAMKDCTVDGTLTANSFSVYYDTVFTVNGTVNVRGEASVAEFGGKSTLNISGSMSCGSMTVGLEEGSISLTGELKVASFESLEALGLNPICYAATQGSDGFTLISPQEPTFETNEFGHILFKTIEELKYLLAQPIAENGFKDYQYVGEGPLVITESITIPIRKYVHATEIIVPEGVTLTVSSMINIDVLQVDGTLTLNSTGNINVREKLEVSGTLNCGSRIDMHGDTGIIGIENIHCDDKGTVKHYLYASTPSEWKNALSIVSEYADPSIQCEIHISENVTLEESATVDGATLVVERLESTRALRIPAGCTLTLNSDCLSLGDIVVEGTLVNNATLSVSGSMQISGGKYSGNGTLQVYCDAESEIPSKLPGLDLTNFVVTNEGSCWVLVPKAIQTLDTLLQDDTKPADVKQSVQEIGAQQLKDAMEADQSGTGAVAKIQALEEKASGGPAAVEVTQNQTQIDQAKASVVGATLNEVTDSAQPVKLVVDEAKQENNQIDTQYNPDTAVTFSMTLTNVKDPAELKVPVRITLPVPEGFSVDELTILHYDSEGKVKEEIPYAANGDGTVSFVVTGFSDFAMVQKAKTLLGDLNGDGKIAAIDAAMIYAAVNNKKVLTDAEFKAADVDGNGKIQAKDASMVYARVNNKLDKFPAEK